MTTFAFWNDVNKIILFAVNTNNQNRVWLIIVAAYLADASEKYLVSKCQTPDVSRDNRPNIELDYSNVQYGDSLVENSNIFSTKTAAYKLIKWSQW